MIFELGERNTADLLKSQKLAVGAIFAGLELILVAGEADACAAVNHEAVCADGLVVAMVL